MAGLGNCIHFSFLFTLFLYLYIKSFCMQLDESKYSYIIQIILKWRFMFWVFTNDPGDRGSIPGRHTKDSKIGTWWLLV